MDKGLLEILGDSDMAVGAGASPGGIRSASVV